MTDNYTLVSRFLVAGEGWRKVETTLGSITLESAAREASKLARELDVQHGNSHFWTVDLTGDFGSYLQLFHGRLA
jgi:hypothetical protein